MNNCTAIRSAPPRALEIRVLTQWADLAAVEGEWRAMHQRCGGRLYSSFDWLAAQHAAFGVPEELRIFTIWQSGRMVAAAPMGLTRQRISKLLPFYRPRVLCGWRCNYTGFFEFLATSRDMLQMLLKTVCAAAPQGGIELETFRVCTRDGFIIGCLRAEGFQLLHDRAQGCAIVENLEDWDQFYQSRSKSCRKKIRGGRNHLKRAKVELAVFDKAGEEPVQRMLSLSSRSWKQASGTGLAALEGGGTFLAELWNRFAAAGNGSIVLLHNGEQDIASSCGVRLGNIWYMLFTEFDETHAKLSPGRMVVCCALQALIDFGPNERVELVRRTHFSKDFETSAYQVQRLRAVPRGSLADWLLKAEGIVRNSASGWAVRRRKRQRRADVVTDGGGSE